MCEEEENRKEENRGDRGTVGVQYNPPDTLA
jgi:hypothetical protein